MRDRMVELAAAGVLFAACNGSLFTIIHEGKDTTIVEAGTVLEALVSDLGFGELINMDVAVSEELANQGVEPGDVDGVYFTDLVLSVTSPSGGDLSFLGGLAFSVSGEGLPTQLVAWQDTFPEGQSTVVLNLEDVDLTDYVVAQTMDIVAEVEGRRPRDQTTIEVSYTLEIGATRQGVCNELKRRKEEE